MDDLNLAALLGNVTPGPDAQIEAMRRMGLLGQLSGDRVLAPVGQGLEQQAQHQQQAAIQQAQFARQMKQNEAQARYWDSLAGSKQDANEIAALRAENERQRIELQGRGVTTTKDALGNIVSVPKYRQAGGAPLRSGGSAPAPGPGPGGGLGAALRGTTDSGISDIAQAIKDGRRPPDLSGLSRAAASAVSAELARDKDYNLAGAQMDWKATQRHIASLNGPQQLRLRQAAYTAQESLGNIESLYNEWLKVGPASGFRIFNKGALAVAKQAPGRAGEVARALEMNIADLTAELGNVYMGGNSPTDHALGLAKQNLSADWNEGQFREALKQAKLNIGYRISSIEHAGVSGASADNKYAPKAAEPAAGAVPMGDGKIKVKRKSDGKVGSMPAANFNPDLYEKL